MENIDYQDIRHFITTAKFKRIRNNRFLKYAALVIALREKGLRYREIIEYLFLNIEELKEIPEADRINNNELCKMVYTWKVKGMIKNEDVLIELKLLDN